MLVLGLGETGLSIAQWAGRQGAHQVRVADSRAQPPGLDALRTAVPHAELRTGAFEHAHLQGIDLVGISPGVPVAEPLVQEARKRGLPVVGDIELFAQALPKLYAGRAQPTVLGVTGTNGKTTVTALTGALVNGAGVDAEIAGNISPAALTALMTRVDRNALPAAWVLELSSYQLETTDSLDCAAATMLNLSEDHLDRYDGIDAYGAAKARIFNGSGVQVLNRDDAASMDMRRTGRAVLTFGLDAPAAHADFGLVGADGAFALCRGAESLLATRELKLAGLHNAANAMAALALIDGMQLPRAAVLEALRNFRGLPHRVEPVATIDEVAYFNDSKGTNVGATAAALAGFARQLAGSPAKVILIAGGDGKGQNFAPLRDGVERIVRAVVLIGRDGARVGAALADTRATQCTAGSMREAIELARTQAQRGDVVLLSPACASFDMFNHYKHRGEVFTQLVREMAGAEHR